MKNQTIIITFLFIIICNNSNSQDIFYNKNEYDNAIKIYKDKLDSYNNYVRKHALFSDTLIAVKTHQYFDNSIWYSYYLPYYAKKVIFFDCPIFRYKPNVIPLKEECVNYVKESTSNKTIITIDDSIKSNSFCSVVYYRFDSPGKAPILIPNVMKKLNPDFNLECREGSTKCPFNYDSKLDFYKNKNWDGKQRIN